MHFHGFKVLAAVRQIDFSIAFWKPKIIRFPIHGKSVFACEWNSQTARKHDVGRRSAVNANDCRVDAGIVFAENFVLLMCGSDHLAMKRTVYGTKM